MTTEVICECGRSMRATHQNGSEHSEAAACRRQLRETCKLGFSECHLTAPFVAKRKLEPVE